MNNQSLESIQSEVRNLRTQLDEAEREKQLLREISSRMNLQDLLDVLGEQIEQSGCCEGYAINLIDEERNNLVCEKLHLPSAFASIEGTYLHFKYPLQGCDPNATVFESHQPLLLDAANIKSYPGITENRFERWRMRSLVVLPIMTDHGALGTAMLFSSEGEVDAQAASVMEQQLYLFSGQLKNAIHHRNLIEKERQINSAIEAQKQFLKFIAQVNSLTSSDSIYDMLSREFLQRFPFDLVGVLTQENEHIHLKRLTAAGERHQATAAAVEALFREEPYTLDEADGATPMVYAQNSALFFPDGMEILELPMSAKDRRSLKTLGTPRTIFIVPIRCGAEVMGVLWLVSLEQVVAVSEADKEFIDLLCSFIGTAMANAELYTTVGRQKSKIEKLNGDLQEKLEELRRLASRDQLTGLGNFGTFQAELRRRLNEYARAEPGVEMSVAIIDIDHFKQVNDTYGHLAGNAVLREVADRIAGQARAMDIVCRYGGEEFAVILPKCHLEGAGIFGERIRNAIAAAPVRVGTDIHVTASVGCACYALGEDDDSLMDRADQALYRAKNNGRNRVELGALAS